jgi:hypothetical protein
VSYTLSLWACGRRSPDGFRLCEGARYLPPGEVPDRCGQESLMFGHTIRGVTSVCQHTMVYEGDYEFELEGVIRGDGEADSLPA